ncbi:hypothetical protein KFE25_007567 [Diacronema lutheri]|uniref:GmrSD restriction endonucleases N-terminal domain-containing protein n=2 Tax=Diacronema lutheri TaxID=2081491 RepID=A0A8J5XRF0_DIALT|nr:hypothetical protein KFE25_007567 [Diacronema lutheri]
MHTPPPVAQALGPRGLPDTDLKNEVICTSQEVHTQPLEVFFAAARPHQIHVPLFQRRFCWGREQVVKLETDVQTAASSGSTLHVGRVLTFIGPNDPRTLICDGQQRLVTLSLFLAAVRDVALSSAVDLPALADEIDGVLFLDGGTRAKTALVPTHEDRAPFYAALARPGDAPRAAVAPSAAEPAAAAPAAPAAPAAANGLHEAKRLLEERTRTSLDLHHAPPVAGAPPADAAACRDAWRARLSTLARALLTRVELVVFRLDEGEEVHRVFEQHAGREKALKTLWNFSMPGMQVSACDLIRNLLVSYVRDEAEQERLHGTYWREMEARATGGSGKPFDLESFFMAFLHAVGFSVGIRPELYTGFRTWISTGVLAEVPADDAAAVLGAIEGALQKMLAGAHKWEAHVHQRPPPPQPAAA